ncbi:hypothetical protein LY78DRAFT_653418 [Colletotrichum sublineola]|nr:hypothetical protein LY78DRAFT_653418 [Colletotrichum sublineola]
MLREEGMWWMYGVVLVGRGTRANNGGFVMVQTSEATRPSRILTRKGSPTTASAHRSMVVYTTEDRDSAAILRLVTDETY